MGEVGTDSAKNPARHSDLAAVWNVRFGSRADITPQICPMCAKPDISQYGLDIRKVPRADIPGTLIQSNKADYRGSFCPAKEAITREGAATA